MSNGERAVAYWHIAIRPRIRTPVVAPRAGCQRGNSRKMVATGEQQIAWDRREQRSTDPNLGGGGMLL